MKKYLHLNTNHLVGKLFKTKNTFLALLLLISTVTFAQVEITPVRVNVTGFSSTWIDTNVTGTSDIRLLQATSSTVSPAMDFDSYNNEELNFKARRQGTGVTAEYVITVSISEDDG